MNTKFAAALSGSAALMILLSGCSNAELDGWAKDVCDGILPQRQKIAAAETATQQVASGNSAPEKVRSTDSKAYQDEAEAYRGMASALEKAGPPPVDGGDKKQKDAIDELRAKARAYDKLKKQVDALNTKDQKKFARELADLAKDLGVVASGGDKAQKKLEEGEVGESMKKQSSCKKISADHAS